MVAENSGMSVYKISCTCANNPHVESVEIFNNKKNASILTLMNIKKLYLLMLDAG